MGKTPDPKPPCARRGLDAARAKASGRGAPRRWDPAVRVVLAVAVEVARVARVVRHALYMGGVVVALRRARERLDSLGRIGPRVGPSPARAPRGERASASVARTPARASSQKRKWEKKRTNIQCGSFSHANWTNAGLAFTGLRSSDTLPWKDFSVSSSRSTSTPLTGARIFVFIWTGGSLGSSWRRGARGGSLGGSWRRGFGLDRKSQTPYGVPTTSATLASTTAPPPFVGVAPRLRDAPSTHARSARDPSLSGRRRGRSSRAPARPRGWTYACG